MRVKGLRVYDSVNLNCSLQCFISQSKNLSLFCLGKCVVPVFSTMAGLCGMAVGIIAWCHQQLK